jgi:hypothetical protein
MHLIYLHALYASNREKANYGALYRKGEVIQHEELRLMFTTPYSQNIHENQNKVKKQPDPAGA